MAVLVGIDEAGFGPILGPMVISSSAFSLPQQLLNADLWGILQRSVSISRKKLAGRLLIVDSKKAYSKSRGIKHLERTVLTCLKSLGKECTTLTEFLTILCPDCVERLNDYPWHKNHTTCHISFDKNDISIASSVFNDDLALHDMRLLGLSSCCLDVAYYNKLVDSVKNKSSVLFSATCQLIKKAWDSFSDEQLQIIIDRQGGRTHYGPVLRQMFPETELRILRENPSLSSYHLQADGRNMRIHFAVGADDRFLPVSLASMVSKYFRELLISNINRYFAGFCADIKPTAGYWKDGLRFIEDLKTKACLQIDDNRLIRCR